MILATRTELNTVCSTKEDDACSQDGYVFQSPEVELFDNRGKTNTLFLSEGDQVYVYDEKNPDNCPVIETTYHEHTHIFNFQYLKPHPEWLEETLVRLLYDSFKNELCNFTITKSSLREYRGTVIGDILLTNLTEIDRRKINSELPFDYYESIYAKDIPCRNQIISHLNKQVYKEGRPYLLRLYDLMKTKQVGTNNEIVSLLVSIAENKKESSDALAACLS